MGSYFTAFLVGGLICVVGQLLLDLTPFTPGHILSGFTVVGGILGAVGIYEGLIKFAGAGALLPISNFGYALVKGAISEVARDGILGVFTGVFELTSTGVTAAIVFGFLMALIFRPQG